MQSWELALTRRVSESVGFPAEAAMFSRGLLHRKTHGRHLDHTWGGTREGTRGIYLGAFLYKEPRPSRPPTRSLSCSPTCPTTCGPTSLIRARGCATVRIPSGKASTLASEASARKPYRTKWLLSVLENEGFANRFFRCSSLRAGGSACTGAHDQEHV